MQMILKLKTKHTSTWLVIIMWTVTDERIQYDGRELVYVMQDHSLVGLGRPR